MITSLRGWDKILLLNNVLHTLGAGKIKSFVNPVGCLFVTRLRGEMGKVPLLTLAIEAATPSTGSSLIGIVVAAYHQSQPTRNRWRWDSQPRS